MDNYGDMPRGCVSVVVVPIREITFTAQPFIICEPKAAPVERSRAPPTRVTSLRGNGLRIRNRESTPAPQLLAAIALSPLNRKTVPIIPPRKIPIMKNQQGPIAQTNPNEPPRLPAMLRWNPISAKRPLVALLRTFCLGPTSFAATMQMRLRMSVKRL